MKFLKKFVLVIFITVLAAGATKGQNNTVSNLIRNLVDVGFSMGESFEAGDKVSVPTGFLVPIDISQNNGYYIYLVMVNGNSGQLKPFYIQTQRTLSTGYNRAIIEPLEIEYVGTAQYLKNRNSKITLLFKEVSSGTEFSEKDYEDEEDEEDNEDDEDYEGTCIKGNCTNGKGTMTWSNGLEYVGQFKEGEKDGQGTLTAPNGGKYVGQFKKGSFNGQGTRIGADGSKLVGQWKDNDIVQGTWLLPNGIKYVGQFKDLKPDGQGTITGLGGKYVGQFKEGKMNGQGTMIWPNGLKYVGQWENDKPTSGSCYDKKGKQIECDF